MVYSGLAKIYFFGIWFRVLCKFALKSMQGRVGFKSFQGWFCCFFWFRTYLGLVLRFVQGWFRTLSGLVYGC